MKTTSRASRTVTTAMGACFALAAAAPAVAAEATQATPPPDVTSNINAAPPPPAPPPPPYSLPFQLRPVTAATVVRLDTSMALYESANAGFKAAGDADGESVASLLLMSYKITPELAPLIRLGLVQNSEPGPAQNRATAFINPIIGVTYAKKLSGPFRLATFLGATLPIGQGGDKSPGVGGSDTAKAVRRGIQARSGMDNAMFAVNYATGIVGLGGAYIAHKLTVQLEATLLQLLRARNENIAADADSKRTNMTAGLHVGYFLAPFISLGAEYRYQQWLSTPVAVKADKDARQTQTIAFGPRFHFKAGTTWLRPGISYATGLDKPLTNEHYHMVQLDLPAVF
jgi:opacity protein-like surface antigen